MGSLRETITANGPQWLAIGGLVIGFVFGAIVCTNSCTMGSVSDIVNPAIGAAFVPGYLPPRPRLLARRFWPGSAPSISASRCTLGRPSTGSAMSPAG